MPGRAWRHIRGQSVRASICKGFHLCLAASSRASTTFFATSPSEPLVHGSLMIAEQSPDAHDVQALDVSVAEIGADADDGLAFRVRVADLDARARIGIGTVQIATTASQRSMASISRSVAGQSRACLANRGRSREKKMLAPGKSRRISAERSSLKRRSASVNSGPARVDVHGREQGAGGEEQGARQY